MTSVATAKDFSVAETYMNLASRERESINMPSVQDLMNLPAYPVAWSLSNLRRSSSTSFDADPWQADSPKEVSTASLSLFEPISTRRISLAMARQIALKILAEAEEERLQLAEQEAARGVDWE